MGFGKGKGGFKGWGGDGFDAWGMPGSWMMVPMPMMMGGGGGGKAKGGRKGKGDRKTVTEKIFVHGLTPEVDEELIKAHFSGFGEVSEVKVMNDGGSGKKGYCFVTFSSKEEAEAAIEEKDHVISDVKLEVEASEVAGTKQMVPLGKRPQQNVDRKPGDWFCPNCGDLVFARRSSCNSCGFGGGFFGMEKGGKKGGKGRPGDWRCEACGDLVFSSRDACNSCNAPKPANARRVGKKPGDWDCPNCGDLVFARKDKCSSCNTAKPEGLEPY
eukprot:TRINITY_DN2630_c0_g3_i1.p1 TRINITY_DN2630_c0_g3~~TRINITY_DN2630_c0_g3_i1.p1  ORF type:complete len:270 (+),score=100.65 TRINITY_DN2630_c0_g3_i1:79-888(+)